MEEEIPKLYKKRKWKILTARKMISARMRAVEAEESDACSAQMQGPRGEGRLF